MLVELVRRSKATLNLPARVLADADRWPSVRELATVGVPRSVFAWWEADDRLTVIPAHRCDGRDADGCEGGPLVRFATLFLNFAVALEPSSGRVVSVYPPADGDEAGAHFVNTSLAHVRATAQAVIGRFPFYSYTADDFKEAAVRAQDDLIALITDTEPRALKESSAWSELPWDVGMCNYGTESFVASD